MASAWEPLVLAWFAALQLLVAAWWWRGPALSRMRTPVAALFVLNGIATALTALGHYQPEPVLRAASLADRWTDVFLLAVCLAALPTRFLPRILYTGILAASGGFLLLTQLVDVGAAWGDPNLGEAVLLVAMMTAGAALALPREDGVQAQATLLVVAVLAMRFIEIAGSIFVNYWLNVASTDTLLPSGIGRAAAVAALLVGGAMTVARAGRRAAPMGARPAALALVAGAFLAVSSSAGATPRTLVYFNIGLVRPLWFVWVMALLAGSGWRGPRWSILAVGSLAAGVSLVALAVAEVMWRLPGTASIAFALGVSLVVLAWGLHWRLRTRARSVVVDATPSPENESFVDARATLPSDWREQVENARNVYATLPPSAQAHLAQLSRWERLVLALSTVPDELPTAYERTTPGLHLITHCPYSLIGPEISRANGRLRVICDGLGVRPPQGSIRLVERRWGPAEGLRSRRASLYRLTPTGRAVAEALRRRIGACDWPASTLRAAVGESFGLSKPVLR